MASPLSLKKSPWKNPNSSMKFMLKRKRIRTTSVTTTKPLSKTFSDNCKEDITKPDNSPVEDSCQSTRVSRSLNPFLTSPIRSKKSKINDDKEKTKLGMNKNRFFELLSGAEDPKDISSNSNTNHPSWEREIEDSSNDSNVVSGSDWSVKSKLRFTTSSVQEYCIDKGSAHSAGIHLITIGNIDVADAAAKFHYLRTYFIFPSIPGIAAFPRSKEKLANVQSVVSDSRVVEKLRDSWRVSLLSLYNSVRADSCPYFYVLFSNYSVLFRSVSCVHELPFCHVLVTPTTSGLRSLLRDDGVVFELPLVRKAEDVKDSEDIVRCATPVDEVAQTPGDEDSDGDEKGVTNDHDTDHWLESVGLDSSALPKARLTSRLEGTVSIPKAESTILVKEAADVHGLFNYMFNMKPVVATDLPATLLSEQPFLGATLQSVECKCSELQQDGGYILELTGPVLPGRLRALVDGGMTYNDVSAVTLDDTIPFTTATNAIVTSNI